MKERLVALANEIETIRILAHEVHVKGFFESDFVLYDVPEFLVWKGIIIQDILNTLLVSCTLAVITGVVTIRCLEKIVRRY